MEGLLPQASFRHDKNKRDSLELIRRPCSEQLAWAVCTAPRKHVARDLDFRLSQRSKSEDVQEHTLELGLAPELKGKPSGGHFRFFDVMWLVSL